MKTFHPAFLKAQASVKIKWAWSAKNPPRKPAQPTRADILNRQARGYVKSGQIIRSDRYTVRETLENIV
jgi:hypothetical protein